MKIFSQNTAFSRAKSHFWINFRTPANIRNLSYGVWTDARFYVANLLFDLMCLVVLVEGIIFSYIKNGCPAAPSLPGFLIVFSAIT